MSDYPKIEAKDIQVGDRIRIKSRVRDVEVSETLTVADTDGVWNVYTAEGVRIAVASRTIHLLDRPGPKIGSFWLDPIAEFVYVFTDQGVFLPIKTPGMWGCLGKEDKNSIVGDRLVPFEGEL